MMGTEENPPSHAKALEALDRIYEVLPQHNIDGDDFADIVVACVERTMKDHAWTIEDRNARQAAYQRLLVEMDDLRTENSVLRGNIQRGTGNSERN